MYEDVNTVDHLLSLSGMCVGLGQRGCEVGAGTLESEVPDGELECLNDMPVSESWGKGDGRHLGEEVIFFPVCTVRLAALLPKGLKTVSPLQSQPACDF